MKLAASMITNQQNSNYTCKTLNNSQYKY